MKGMMNNKVRKYKSQTVWQGEPQWELVITMGEFDDIEAAARFGNEDIKKLKYDRSSRQLIFSMSAT